MHFSEDVAKGPVPPGALRTVLIRRQAGKGTAPLVRDPRAAASELRRIRWDTWSGVTYSNVTAYCIILATAVMLHAAGTTDIEPADHRSRLDCNGRHGRGGRVDVPARLGPAAIGRHRVALRRPA